MDSRQPRPGAGCRRGLAVFVVLFAPAFASAGSITVYNDDPAGVPVVVQAVTVIRGALVRDKPYLLGRGDKATIALPGNKVVTIYDARVANRVLFQGVVPDSTDDLHFGIAPDLPPPKLKLVARRGPPLMRGN
jgi:hypothetical protein